MGHDLVRWKPQVAVRTLRELGHPSGDSFPGKSNSRAENSTASRNEHLSGRMVWLVGRLAGWLAGCLAGWLADWLAAWLAGWLAGVWLVAWLAGCCLRCRGLAWLLGWGGSALL